MIIEYTRYKIEETRRATFLNDYRKAAEFLKASRSCLAHELTQCAKDEDHFILRLEWDSKEGHLKEFRNGSECKAFFAVVRPYVNDIEEMSGYWLPDARGRKD